MAAPLQWTDVVAEATAAMLARWELLAARGQPVELAAVLRELTAGIMRQILFGADTTREAQAAGQAITSAVGQLDRHIWALLPAPRWLPTRRNHQLQQALHALDAYVHRRIAAHSRLGSAADNLLARLLAVRDGTTGERMSAGQLRDKAVTLWVAGQTTVAAALAWTDYLLAQSPDAARALQAELATVLDGRRPTPRDLPRLRYTRLVLAEGMGLYPPTWVTARTPLVEDAIGGHRIPAWSVGRPRFVYFPFGGGPRRCIGQSLAMLEMLVILAMTAQTYELRPVPRSPVEPDPLITLRPRHGMLVTLCQRRPLR